MDRVIRSFVAFCVEVFEQTAGKWLKISHMLVVFAYTYAILSLLMFVI